MARHLIPFFRGPNSMVRAAKKRRASFGSMTEAMERYEQKAAFKSWRDPFLADYLLDGLERVDDNPAESEEQTWNLLCAPNWEAATFAAQRNRPWSAIKKVRKKKIPLTILRASTGSVMSNKTVEQIQTIAPGAQIKTIRGASHFLPMEVPYSVRDELSGFIARLVEGFSAAEEGPVKRSLR